MLKNNNKGFTLVELLAVIVILAVILVIVVPKIFDTIDDSKKKALLSSASGLVKSWETKTASDYLNGISGSSYKNVGVSWRCISTTEANNLELSSADYVISANEPVDGVVVVDTCSAVRLNENDNIEVLLVARVGGSVYTTAGVKNSETAMWGMSNGDNSWTLNS